MKPYKDRHNADLKRYMQEFEADPEKLRQLIEEPDVFERSIPVYTFDNGEIIEKQCEARGWPNVTHDGQLMYKNTYSEDKEQVIEWAEKDLDAYIKMIDERIVEVEKDLKALQDKMSILKLKKINFEEVDLQEYLVEYPLAWQMWLAIKKAVEGVAVPDACVGVNSLMLDWDDQINYLECEIFSDHKIEFFYRNRKTDEKINASASVNAIPSAILEKLRLFKERQDPPILIKNEYKLMERFSVAWKVWLEINYKVAGMEKPEVGQGIDGVIQLSWAKPPHTLECKVHNESKLEFFYGNLAEHEPSDRALIAEAAINSIPSEILEKLRLFAQP